MNLGADDYLAMPASAEEVLTAINARLDRHNDKEEAAMAKVERKRNFESAKPLEPLGLTPREAEVLLWVAQGKSNGEIGTILGCAENTIKVHLARIFEKQGFENRNAANCAGAGNSQPSDPTGDDHRRTAPNAGGFSKAVTHRRTWSKPVQAPS